MTLSVLDSDQLIINSDVPKDINPSQVPRGLSSVPVFFKMGNAEDSHRRADCEGKLKKNIWSFRLTHYRSPDSVRSKEAEPSSESELLFSDCLWIWVLEGSSLQAVLAS